jgi:broad specificity phosphatase PhoE
MKEIYLVRHGESWHNAQGTIAGQQDSFLTAQGEADARIVAQLIGSTPFDAIYCSDLVRARQTAEIIVEELGLTTSLVFSELLRELDYGEYTNRSLADTRKFLNYRSEPQRSFPGGEGLDELEVRLNRFLQESLRQIPGKRILVVAHAGSIRMLIVLLDPARREHHLHQPLGNRFLCKVTLDENHKMLHYEEWADCSHDE